RSYYPLLPGFGRYTFEIVGLGFVDFDGRCGSMAGFLSKRNETRVVNVEI
ncbi:hypothetical protein AKJ16_DCAP26539, partial [Drosera capensis]